MSQVEKSESATKKGARLVSLTIDGRAVEIEEGKNIFDAAVKAGIYIPGLCYDDRLIRFGGCRLCMVDVTARGRTRSKWACCEPAKDGIEVCTDSPEIRKSRQMMMEFLLMHHPLDCPTCNASGDCGLQEAAYFLDLKKGRLKQKRSDEPLLIDNPVLERDYNKCILCGKCVGACHELQGNGAIDYQKRGFGSEVGTPFRIPLVCDYCGQCLQICPVGSFMDHTEKFKGHSWEYEKVKTTCAYCSVGCSLTLNLKNGSIAKVTSEDKSGVNLGLLCARGRFGHDAYQAPERASRRLIRSAETDDESAFKFALERLGATLKKDGPGAIGVIGGEGLTNEDLYALARFARAGLGATYLTSLSQMGAPSLHSSLFARFGDRAPIVDYSAINDADAFVFIGADLERENPVVGNLVRMAMRDNGAKLYLVNSSNSRFTPAESIALVHDYGDEIGALGRVIEAVGSGEDSSDLAARLGAELGRTKRALIIIGDRVASHLDSESIVEKILELADRIGARSLLLRSRSNSQGAADMGFSERFAPGYLELFDQETLARYERAWGAPINAPTGSGQGSLIERIESARIKALIVTGDDPLVESLDGRELAEALKKLDTLIVAAPYMSPIGQMATVFFPTATAVEKNGSFVNNEGRAQPTHKGAALMSGAIPEWKLFSDFAGAFGLKGGYKSAWEITDEIAMIVPGYKALSAAAIRDGGGGLVDYSAARARVDHARSDRVSPSAPVEPSGQYRYLALAGPALFRLGLISQRSSTLEAIEPDPYMEIHPNDAAELSLRSGSTALVESSVGSLELKVKIDRRSRVGTIVIPGAFEAAPANRLFARGKRSAAVRISLLEDRSDD